MMLPADQQARSTHEIFAVKEPEVVRSERRECIGLLIIDNPPVNASSEAVRRGLLRGLAEFDDDPGITAIVLIGAERNFVSGSDLKEFSAETIPQPELPEVIAAIRGMGTPVIAAISGATLGGGLELALSCDRRIALADTTVGFPEVTLGMIPGAGGTQRALHLLGPVAAIALTTSGRRHPVKAEEVAGLVDLIVDENLEDHAIEYARTVSDKDDVLASPVPGAAAGEVETAARDAFKRHQNQQTIAAVGAILAGLALPPEAAMTHERREFTRLRASDEAAALRHVFFSRRAAAKANRPSGEVSLTRVAVIGSGTMGRGIARAFADHGVSVIVHDIAHDALDSAQEQISHDYRRLVHQARLTAAEAEARLKRITFADSIDAVAGSGICIEAVVEDLEVKKSVLAALETAAGDAILATNTSYLDLERLALGLCSPERLVGLHFFSPAHRTPIVEVVHGRRTAAHTLDVALTAAKALQKLAIRAAVGEGFIGNRVFSAYRRQCELMLLEGALPQDVDAALENFGFRMGPFAVADMSGLDIAWRMRCRLAQTGEPASPHSDIADQLCNLGRFGQKTGAGWYHYGEDGRTPISDPEVERIILATSSRLGVERRSLSAAEITRRAVLAMSNETAQLLAEGICDRATDVDLMMILGYGFPDFRGGPVHWARGQHSAAIDHGLTELEGATGPGFRRGDLSLLQN